MFPNLQDVNPTFLLTPVSDLNGGNSTNSFSANKKGHAISSFSPAPLDEIQADS